RAAMFHDKGWIRYETSPIYDAASGRTPNYREVPNSPAQLDAFEWAGDWLTNIDRYAGLLISRHRTGLWQSRYRSMTQPPAIQHGKLSSEIEAFIARNEERQKAAAKNFDARELAVNYHLLQVWDLLSLSICSNEKLKSSIIEPVPTSYAVPDGVRMQITPLSPDTVALDPYPFDQPSLIASVIYRRLRGQSFADQNAFQAAYFATAPQLAHYTFVDASRSSH
ncbi:MAG: hypothetical protein QOF91_2750, partial [Alphaproteobacteria bacterium]|nr:hypothetical protein [Alphaproteobacteria bacterium]